MGVLTFYLAAYPEVQEKLQDEIDELFDSKDDGEELQAEDLTGMKYLDQVERGPPQETFLHIFLSQVLKEGQRLGCFGMTARTCTKNWQIPGETFVIPKNTRVVIPIVILSNNIYRLCQKLNLFQAGMHYDPEYWPEPTKFDPERFSNENKGKIESITFQIFGGGPR